MKVHPLGPKDREVVLRSDLRQATSIRTNGVRDYHPVFVVWRNVEHSGTTVRKGRVVVDIRGLNCIGTLSSQTLISPLSMDMTLFYLRIVLSLSEVALDIFDFDSCDSDESLIRIIWWICNLTLT